ncbi:MAG TPA: GNVR domain-containing protein [Verrucomicrobiae bacterium]|nr:GNVR domain-containing protein [Verrucomicrobiae bacterium]
MNITSMGQSFRLREYYYMVLRHKLLLAITVLACVVGSVSFSFSLPKVYRSETVLMIQNEQILNPLISGLAITPSEHARLRALREQLLSWPRLTLLAEKLQLDKKVKSPLEYETLIRNLRNNIDIKMRGDGIIVVAADATDAKQAQNIVEALATIIVEGTLTSTNLQANSAIQFITDQLDQYRTKLESSETKLRQFSELYSATLPVATRLNEQLVQLKMDLNNLMVDNTPKHPRVIQTQELIRQLEEQRDKQFRAAKDAGFDVGDENYARLVSSVPLQEQELARLRRDYNVNNNIYQQFLQKLETAKLSQTLEESEKGLKFSMLEPARLPLKPFKPNRVIISIAGIFIGLGAGIALIFLIEMSNNSIRTVDEARELLELPIFGTIATINPEELLLGERLKADAAV